MATLLLEWDLRISSPGTSCPLSTQAYVPTHRLLPNNTLHVGKELVLVQCLSEGIGRIAVRMDLLGFCDTRSMAFTYVVIASWTCFFLQGLAGSSELISEPRLSPMRRVSPLTGTPRDLSMYQSEMASSVPVFAAHNWAVLVLVSMAP